MTDARPTRGREPVSLRVRIRYLVVGLVIGGLWIIHRDEPIWEHAVRTLAVLLILPPLAQLALGWLARRRAAQGNSAVEPAERFSFVRFAAAKVVLVVVWLGIDLALAPFTPAADFVVAAGLALSLALLGPALHHHLMVPVRADR